MKQSDALQILRKALGDTAQFRDDQWAAIDTLVHGNGKLLLVQKTGWGKSVVYFLATRILRDQGRGPTLIVSPLLSLMRNQEIIAEKIGINAQCINSQNKDEWLYLHERAKDFDVFLVTPEQLADGEFITQVFPYIAESVGMLVVDEAHCISDWGHDFRPDYRRLVNLLKRIPNNTPILGTTATANNRVINDVKTQLGDLKVIRGALMRKSLELQTMPGLSKYKRLAWLKQHIGELPGTGLIYALTKRDVMHVTTWLNQNQIAAEAYHADMLNEERIELEQKLQQNQIKVLVCTVALGMGYDKPDLGFVIHYQCPDSVVSYYQQIGRAGRSISRAICVLMSGYEDEYIHEYFRNSAFPSKKSVQKILDTLEQHEGLKQREIEKTVNIRPGEIDKVLKVLAVDNPAPIVKDNKVWIRTALDYEYRLDDERIIRLKMQRVEEWQQMQDLLNYGGCLMEFLAKELNDIDPQPCGKCSNCIGSPVVSLNYEADDVSKAKLLLRNSLIELEPRKRLPSDAFVEYDWLKGGNLRKDLQASKGMVLSRWKDDGWGSEIATDVGDGKTGMFRDGLVDALAEGITKRWDLQPDDWVTCIPSSTDIVRDFAARLAGKLNLVFAPALTKVRENERQKTQQNPYFQCKNLDGVFAVTGETPKGPVFLVDDFVDSGFTMTVASALLLKDGVKEVRPVALATTSPGK